MWPKRPAPLNPSLTPPIGVTLLPYFSQRLSRGDDRNCRLFFVRYSVIVTLAGVSIAAAAVFGSEPFVRFAFQRGQFLAQDTLFVAALQHAYLWQLACAKVASVGQQFVAAKGRYRAVTVDCVACCSIT